MADRNTVYALASAPGRAGVAVVRLSGDKTLTCLKTLTGKENFKPRQARLCRFCAPGGRAIDEGLVLFFPAPHSYTGEDVAELHLHGSRAVLEAIFAVLASHAGVRMAEPGEFTRRAVENGKLDLTQAEAVADLVDAETQSQRVQALDQLGGALSALYEGWRQKLIAISAEVEAAIDFADEDIPDDTLNFARQKAQGLAKDIAAHLGDARRGEIVREGVKVAIIGPPNAGKSSLLNALARRDVAIVSAEPGTTRDVIEVRLDIAGMAMRVFDTAGLREATGVEGEGIRRAQLAAENADIIVLLRDGTLADVPLENFIPTGVQAPVICAWNKADLPCPVPRDGLSLSVKSGAGLDRLLSEIARRAQEAWLSGTGAPLTRPRHRVALQAALSALDRATMTTEPELFAEDIRLALRAIGRITGAVDVEDILDVVFRDFCIGK